jgi:tellurite methyltransferase
MTRFASGRSRALPDWDERYRRGENIGEDPNPLLVTAVRDQPPGVALDLACGAGRNSLFLAANGWKVTGVDNSVAALGLLRRRATDQGFEVDTVRADLERHEYQVEADAFDLICDIHYLQRDLFQAIRMGIRRGGLFVASIHLAQPQPDLSPMNPAFLLKPGELREYFKGWELKQYWEGRRENGCGGLKRAAAEIIARRPVG